jgi:hypothetical protein
MKPLLGNYEFMAFLAAINSQGQNGLANPIAEIILN